ncbi:hypothetical protein [Nostoc sp. FACHB-145]|uniref:hypothetical protein n=1 Tax=Nostoc sp. FACHB-145 TaxID=2692836 RepID=UPI001682F8F5|nr:hypothetical protein [Nostoc sp. FACHB-145]MBD2471403.1 hypothetical protein [Nostoc sp. FACHB-145]
MTVALVRPGYREFETETADKLFSLLAPHIPPAPVDEPRPITSKEELENFAQYLIAGAAHDSYIVQVIGRAIANIVPDDLHLQLFLSRQLGDDGAHAQYSRERVQVLLGYDPIDEIKRQVQEHWNFFGDLSTRSLFGFLAFEFHYELHIVAGLLVNKRLTQVNDPETSNFVAQRILPDETEHRIGVIDWWRNKYGKVSGSQKAELIEQIIELDNEGQKRRNAYLKNYWKINHVALGIGEVKEQPAIYDAWRQEVLSYVLDVPVDQLPKLVSVND